MIELLKSLIARGEDFVAQCAVESPNMVWFGGRGYRGRAVAAHFVSQHLADQKESAYARQTLGEQRCTEVQGWIEQHYKPVWNALQTQLPQVDVTASLEQQFFQAAARWRQVRDAVEAMVAEGALPALQASYILDAIGAVVPQVEIDRWHSGIHNDGTQWAHPESGPGRSTGGVSYGEWQRQMFPGRPSVLVGWAGNQNSEAFAHIDAEGLGAFLPYVDAACRVDAWYGTRAVTDVLATSIRIAGDLIGEAHAITEVNQPADGGTLELVEVPDARAVATCSHRFAVLPVVRGLYTDRQGLHGMDDLGCWHYIPKKEAGGWAGRKPAEYPQTQAAGRPVVVQSAAHQKAVELGWTPPPNDEEIEARVIAEKKAATLRLEAAHQAYWHGGWGEGGDKRYAEYTAAEAVYRQTPMPRHTRWRDALQRAWNSATRFECGGRVRDDLPSVADVFAGMDANVN